MTQVSTAAIERARTVLSIACGKLSTRWAHIEIGAFETDATWAAASGWFDWVLDDGVHGQCKRTFTDGEGAWEIPPPHGALIFKWLTRDP